MWQKHKHRGSRNKKLFILEPQTHLFIALVTFLIFPYCEFLGVPTHRQLLVALCASRISIQAHILRLLTFAFSLFPFWILFFFLFYSFSSLGFVVLLKQEDFLRVKNFCSVFCAIGSPPPLSTHTQIHTNISISLLFRLPFHIILCV